jgi:hypothetical protein
MKALKFLFGIIIIFGAIAIYGYSNWSSIINWMMPANSRPAKIQFASETITPKQFEKLSEQLKANRPGEYKHIENFKKENILSYEGHKTCLTCHKEITIKDAITGQDRQVDLLHNLTTSAHYRFFTNRHPNVYGFNGELADNFPMGKIDRPCPKPGSFAFTAWASLVPLKNGDTLSEGCGQCHIGGQNQAPLGELMPGYVTKDEEKEAIDCLICHATAYDMNKKQVAINEDGYAHWDQDRSMLAAMSVTRPTAQNCLRCHQHNFGGDIYVDSANAGFMQSLVNHGTNRPRVLHPGSKRGTPYSPSWDVHAAAGVACIDCHTTEGHYIAKGTHTTTMMANDLPDVEVSCEKCHSNKPHSENKEIADYLNNHIERVACQTCHIPSLHPDNATLRDFANPVFEEHPGIYVYDDILKATEPGSGIIYAWWNGDATFLGNPIGDNPNGKDLYRFYNPTNIWPEYKDYDYAGWYEKVMRPIAQKRPSKLYAMKRFNGRQHIDLQNIGPFGGMYVPYNLPTYFASGNPDQAASKEMEHDMMKMMYGFMFKYYLMDKFMSFMDVDEWNSGAYKDAQALKKVEPRWIPNDALLEISHSVRRQGALTCNNCHNPNGVLDWKALGYPDDEVEALTQSPL